MLTAGVAIAFQLVVPSLSARTGLMVSDLLIAVAAGYASAQYLRRAHDVRGRARAAMVSGFSAAGLWSLANVAYFATASGLTSPAVGRWGDIFSVTAAVLVPVGLLLLAPAVHGMARVRRAIDVAAVSGATFAVTWQMLLSPSLHGSHAADALMAAVLAAPEVLAAAVALVTMAGNLPTRDSRALHLLATAAIVLAVTVLLAWHNIRTGAAWYAQGVGGGYIFAAGVMAVASRHGVPPAAPAGVRRHVSGAWALLPYVPIMLAVAAAASAQVRTGSLEPMLVWVLLATFCLVVLRQFLTLATVAKMAIKLEQQQRVLAHQAHHDPLTGLPNRAAFHDAADAVLAEPARRVTVMLLDLDGFKPVNDTLGHAAGDAVLVQTAHRLVAAVRPGDLVARLGGDEFVILLEGADSGIGTAVARRVLSVIAEPMTVDGTTVRVGCSVGLTARPPGQSETVSSLLSQADMAMYAAKAAGKGAIRCHEPARASMLV